MPTSERPLAGKRGLVVDDEFLIVLDLQALLEESGAEIICQGSTEKAIAALETQGPFDFAVLDLHVGGGIESGLTVAARLQALGIPFVFLSGMNSKDPRVTSLNAPLVEKPYRPDLLVGAIAKIVGG